MFPGPIFAGDELVIDAEIVRSIAMLGHVEVRTRDASRRRRRRRLRRGARWRERRCLTTRSDSARRSTRTFAAATSPTSPRSSAATSTAEPRADGLVGGLFSTLLGTTLPGRGTNWMKQTLRFRSRARVGERLTASVEIVRLRPEKRLVNLRVVCVNDAGATICDGESLVMALEMEAGERDYGV